MPPMCGARSGGSLRRRTSGTRGPPRQLRHSFVSIASDGGVPLKVIADLCGRSSTAVIEEVCRRRRRPVIITGAETIGNVVAVRAAEKPGTVA